VLRAIRRDNALPALRERVAQLLAEGEPATPDIAELQTRTVARAFELAEQAAADDRADLARQVASGLYHATTLAGLRWEARQAGLPQRADLAVQVLRHRLAVRDPLASDAEPTAHARLPDGD
jgi:hypothetical protein